MFVELNLFSRVQMIVKEVEMAFIEAFSYGIPGDKKP